MERLSVFTTRFTAKEGVAFLERSLLKVFPSEMSAGRFFRLRTVALLFFLLAVVLYSWNSDDAYHSYVMAKHLADGKGLVYSTGYRTTASTCPLLTLFQAAVFLFTGSADICGLLLGLLFSGAAAWILFFRICTKPVMVFCSLGLLVSSRCFMSFTTSGLENSLLFFLGAVFFALYFRHGLFGKRQLLVLAVLMSLLAMSRTDSVLVFVPMAVWAYLGRTKIPFFQRVVIGIIGLFPFVAWTGFSIVYYGFPFPNTYYAKLYTGIPLVDYVKSGLWYHYSSWLLDPMLLFVPLLSFGLAVRSKIRESIPVFLGFVLYSFYVVYIGGDFMAGRHLTLMFFLSICLLASFSKNVDLVADEKHSQNPGAVLSVSNLHAVSSALFIVGVVWSCFAAPLVISNVVNISFTTSTRRSAVDERMAYISWIGPHAKLYRGIPDYLFDVDFRFICHSNLIHSIVAARDKDEKGYCADGSPRESLMFGYAVWKCRDLDMFLTDAIALPDPLLARLKVDNSKLWRIGHAYRAIPDGYMESLSLGENKIVNRALHQYYDKLLLVMTGDLFGRERLSTILDFNRGRYERLLDEYEQSEGADGVAKATELLRQALDAIQTKTNSMQALTILDQCLGIPGSKTTIAVAHYYRGLAFEDLKNDFETAETEYRTALSGGFIPELAACANRLAALVASNGDVSEAISILESAIKKAPCNPDCLKQLADHYRASGDDYKAEVMLTRLKWAINR